MQSRNAYTLCKQIIQLANSLEKADKIVNIPFKVTLYYLPGLSDSDIQKVTGEMINAYDKIQRHFLFPCISNDCNHFKNRLYIYSSTRLLDCELAQWFSLFCSLLLLWLLLKGCILQDTINLFL